MQNHLQNANKNQKEYSKIIIHGISYIESKQTDQKENGHFRIDQMKGDKTIDKDE